MGCWFVGGRVLIVGGFVRVGCTFTLLGGRGAPFFLWGGSLMGRRSPVFFFRGGCFLGLSWPRAAVVFLPGGSGDLVLESFLWVGGGVCAVQRGCAPIFPTLSLQILSPPPVV